VIIIILKPFSSLATDSASKACPCNNYIVSKCEGCKHQELNNKTVSFYLTVTGILNMETKRESHILEFT
jgi:hypothetical protein